MQILKYIINDKEFPLIFSKETLHSDIYTVAISAGFVIINFDYLKQLFSVKCFGESSSLGISSRLIDNEIIEKHINSCIYLFKEVIGLP